MRINKSAICANFGVPRSRNRELTHKKTLKNGNFWLENLLIRHSRRTRSQTTKNLYIAKFSFSRCQKSIKYQGSKIWNGIPINIKDQSFNKFKITVKTHFLRNTKDNKQKHLLLNIFYFILQSTMLAHSFFFLCFEIIFASVLLQ